MSHIAPSAIASDRRARKTKAAIQKAFTGLFLEQGIDAVSVGHIADRADISRSTFYQHFGSKDDVLCTTMSPMLTIMAETVISATEPERLAALTTHFWTNRKLARAVFSGSAKLSVARLLADQIEARLTPASGESGSARLIAVHLAAAQLALLEEWLSGRYRCAPNALATMLYASSHAAARAVLPPARGCCNH